MTKSRKIHYHYVDEGSPPLAAFCTPKTNRGLVTDAPGEVTCRVCRVHAEADTQDQNFDKELAARPWWSGLVHLNMGGRHFHLMFGAVISIFDSLVVLTSFGAVLTNFHLAYLLRSMRNQ